jgi:hypothetical protein
LLDEEIAESVDAEGAEGAGDDASESRPEDRGEQHFAELERELAAQRLRATAHASR